MEECDRPSRSYVGGGGVLRRFRSFFFGFEKKFLGVDCCKETEHSLPEDIFVSGLELK